MSETIAKAAAPMLEILVDADACPVKEEIYRVAERTGARVFIVANRLIATPRDKWITRIMVDMAPDAADDWIAGRARSGAIVVTADILLASRCVKTGAAVIAPNGRAYTEATIGQAVAIRNLMHELRAQGDSVAGPKAFSKRDRSAFLGALDLAIARLRRRD